MKGTLVWTLIATCDLAVARASGAGVADVAGDAVSVGTDADLGKASHAARFSPQDNVYDVHKVNNDDTFHAPKVAPNDKQTETKDAKKDEKKIVKAVSEEAEKGSKGSVILDDYDPTRLGVSADEAKEKAKPKDAKDAKDAKDTVKESVRETKDVKDAAKDIKKKSKSGMSPTEENKPPGSSNEKPNPHDVVYDKNGNVINQYSIEGDTFTDVKNKAKEKLKDAEDAVKDTAKDAYNEVKDYAKDAYNDVKDSFKDSGKDVPMAKASDKARDKDSERKLNPAQSQEAITSKLQNEPAVVEEPRFGRLLGSAVMIIVSEIGDKTFFIAALMAMRHAPLFVFSASYSAMVLMTVLSMVLGLILPSLLSRKVSTLLAAALFLVFGCRMVVEAWSMDKSLAATDEMEEVENDLALHDSTRSMEKAEGGGIVGSSGSLTADNDNPKNKLNGKHVRDMFAHVLSPVWIQIFAMTFLGEWGDRSQIATVAMGAGEGWIEVLVGCLAGHFVMTVIAVLGGKILAQHLSLRTITFSGALCFLAFAVFYFNDWLSERV